MGAFLRLEYAFWQVLDGTERHLITGDKSSELSLPFKNVDQILRHRSQISSIRKQKEEEGGPYGCVLMSHEAPAHLSFVFSRCSILFFGSAKHPLHPSR
jgi:hypothetical protein